MYYNYNISDLYNLSDIQLPKDDHRPGGMPSIAWNPFMDLKSRDDVAKLHIKFPYGEIPREFQVGSIYRS